MNEMFGSENSELYREVYWKMVGNNLPLSIALSIPILLDLDNDKRIYFVLVPQFR